MKNLRTFSLVGLLLLLAAGAQGATFVVPTDEELVAKSAAIASGTVEGSYVQETEKEIETVYEIRVDRTFKGGARLDDLVRVVQPGGVIGDRGVIVPGAARFAQGERVLVFLRREKGRWETTDLTLGKFAFRTTTSGERVLVRDMEDVVGWDHAGRVHHEKVRREAGFLRFIEERTQGRAAKQDYVVDASEVTLAPAPSDRFDVTTNAAPFPAATYTDWVNNQPIRWPSFGSGLNYWKRSDQNIAGAADGGVSVIIGGLAAWTNECNSLINIVYGGQMAKASQNHDGTNIIEFNDPQGRVGGSWTGSGTIGIAFLSFAGEHTFNGQSWLNITDGDVVFQDGYPATNGAFRTAMTHEIGHTLGWRHSNQDYASGGACNSATQECTSAAIMNSVSNASYGHTLQPWDINAAQSVYPGGTCGPPPPTCTPPSITAQPASATIQSGASTTLSVTAAGTSPAYQWYGAINGNSFAPISGATSRTLTVTPSFTTAYYVVVSNACGTVTSNTIVVTVKGGSTAGASSARVLSTSRAEWRMIGAADFNGDGYPDILLQNTVTRDIYVWMMRDAAVISTNTFIGRTASGFEVRAIGDFNRDGSPDLVVQNDSTRDVYIWRMNGTSVVNTSHFVIRAAPNWRVVAAADFTADAIPDILVQNQVDRQTAVWGMNGLTMGDPNHLLIPTAAGWMAYAAGDMNRDGWGDVLVRSSTNGQNAVWLTAGLRVTSTSTLLPTLSDTSWRMVGVADFNRDGSLDILWQNTSTRQTAIWYMNGTALRP